MPGSFCFKSGKLTGLSVEGMLALPAERVFDVGDMQKDDLAPVVAQRDILSIEVYCPKIRCFSLL